jgi:endogenous inhibitor of DNA gyrase (YacG/DUF329 family)
VIDLGRWPDGAFRVPGAPLPLSTSAAPGGTQDDE